MNNSVNPKDRNIYIVGSGIAGLASAVYFIQEGHIPPKNINIFEQENFFGGSMDGAGNNTDGFISHGARMFDKEAYVCTYDLFSRVPCLYDENMTILDDFNKFNKETKFNRSSVRLIGENAEKIDVLSFELNRTDQLSLTNMMIHPEIIYENGKISDFFSEEFFHTNFWYMWCTTFAFQPWHSAKEFRRYLHRFVHEFPHVTDLAGVRHSRFNQFDSVILPIITWLKKEGVIFKTGCRVTDLKFQKVDNKKAVKTIEYIENGQNLKIDISSIDLVLATIGSMTSGFSVGDNDTKTVVYDKHKDGSWDLWENIAKNDPSFGNPEVFNSRINESLWESITLTFKNTLFFDLVHEFCSGTGTEFTFKDSNWLLSLVLPKQPHFLNQSEDIQVAWGYALHPDKEGKFINKKMYDCTGKEILEEIIGLLKFDEHKKEILDSAICKPCVMPFITSQFLTWNKEDKPEVVPKVSRNLAFIGQFCEVKDDTTFTVDYSIRSAQIAVYGLLGLTYKEVTPIYEGEHDTRVLLGALATMIK